MVEQDKSIEEFQKTLRDIEIAELEKKGFDPEVQAEFFRRIGRPIPGARLRGETLAEQEARIRRETEARRQAFFERQRQIEAAREAAERRAKEDAAKKLAEERAREIAQREAIRERAEFAAGIRRRAKEAGVSPEVQATREGATGITEIREAIGVVGAKLTPAEEQRRVSAFLRGQEQDGAIVSESIFKSLQEKAKAGDIKAIETLGRVSAVAEIREAREVPVREEKPPVLDVLREVGVLGIGEPGRPARFLLETKPGQFAKELFVGDIGKRFTGIGQRASVIIPPITPKPLFTFTEIKDVLRERKVTETIADLTRTPRISILPQVSKTQAKIRREAIIFGAKVTAELVPETPAEVSVLAATPTLFRVSPAVLRTGVSLGFGVLGTITAVDTDLSPAERTAGGVVGVLGFAGAGAELTPFARGLVFQQRALLRETATRGKFPTITGRIERFPKPSPIIIPISEIGRLALIRGGRPPRGVRSTDPAFIRGAFGTPKKVQASFIGKKGVVTSSQRSLFKTIDLQQKGFKKILPKEVPILPGEARIGLFGTPEQLGIPQTRLTRLGLTQFFKVPRKPGQISFKFPERPQVLVFRDVLITRRGRPGTFRAIGLPTGELEVTALPGQQVRRVAKLGKFTIQGQGVNVFLTKLISGRGQLQKIPSLKGVTSTIPTTQIIPTTSILAALGTRVILPKRITRVIAKPSKPPIIKIRRVRKDLRKVSIPTRITIRDITSPILRRIIRESRVPITPVSPPLRPPTRPPTPPKFPPKIPFLRRRRVGLKRKKEELLGREDAAFIEGFTARQLQLPKRIIKAINIEKELSKLERQVGIRGAPIIVR